jgi:mRNA interferase HigB
MVMSSKIKPRETSQIAKFFGYSSPKGVEGKFVFNVKGNTYRLIASINFKSQLLVIEHVMTHADYDKGGWK